MGSYGLWVKTFFIENIVYFTLSTVILLRMNVLLTVIALITMPAIAVITVKLEKQLDSVFEKNK